MGIDYLQQDNYSCSDEKLLHCANILNNFFAVNKTALVFTGIHWMAFNLTEHVIFVTTYYSEAQGDTGHFFKKNGGLDTMVNSTINVY